MGNQTCGISNILSSDMQIPNLKKLSQYGQDKQQFTQQQKIIFNSIFPKNKSIHNISQLLTLISKQKIFTDSHFKLDSQNSARLSVMYNFKTNKMEIYQQEIETKFTTFTQFQIQFSYLTCVFYLLCKKEVKNKLLPKIIDIQQKNTYLGVYSGNFACNGENVPVIVDDIFPIINDNFVYLRLITGTQLWPVILQKMWCKLIGSYEKAKGLSPQDAFEQITGIPAYSYQIKVGNKQYIKNIINNSVRNKYWVTFVAKNNLVDFPNRQVFYLKQKNNNNLTLISPYTNFHYKKTQKNRGQVTMNEDDIFFNFEYIVVGFYHEDYSIITAQIQCQKRKQIVFQLQVRQLEDISIRFNQFYDGYLNKDAQNYYKYSPILIQVYQIKQRDGQKVVPRLLPLSQGCSRSLYGARSIHCFRNIVEKLQGRYLIRMQIDWLNESIINKGNLVIYGRQHNIRLKRIDNISLLHQIYQRIFETCLKNNQIQKLSFQEHNIDIVLYHKQKTSLIMVSNKLNSKNTFQLDFSTSQNILIRGENVKGEIVNMVIQGNQKKIIQIMPKDLKRQMILNNFDITKIPNHV